MNNFLDRSIDKLELLIKHNLREVLEEEAVPEIKNLILDAYEDKLEGVVESNYTNIIPETYKEDFITRLEDFEYIKEDDNNVSLSCPDIENFDFEDGLEFIYNIVTGMVGNYYKVHSYKLGYKDEDYMFIVGEDSEVLEGINTDELELYEFSETEVDIFSDAEEFVEENMSSWVDKANEIAVNKFADYHAGVNIYG